MSNPNPKSTTKFGKGNPGKPKGAVNKTTREFREVVNALLQSSAPHMVRWLTLVAEGDGTDSGKPDPAKALDLLAKLAEYAAPKLARTEHVGDDNQPIVHEFRWKSAK